MTKRKYDLPKIRFIYRDFMADNEKITDIDKLQDDLGNAISKTGLMTQEEGQVLIVEIRSEDMPEAGEDMNIMGKMSKRSYWQDGETKEIL